MIKIGWLNVKRSKILKFITFLIIFTTIFSLNIDINVSQYGTSSSLNKHFLQLGIEQVEAASVNYSLYSYSSWNNKDGDRSTVSSTIKITELAYDTETGYLNVIGEISYAFSLYAANTYGKVEASINSATLFNREQSSASPYVNTTSSINKTIYIGKGLTSVTLELYTHIKSSSGTYLDSDNQTTTIYLNSNPILAITEPTPNSPLQSRQAYIKEAV